MTITQVVQNDTAPRLNFTLTQDGSPINLSGAAVLFKFRKQGASANVFSRACTITDAANGECYYDWQANDLASVGAHRGEVEVTFSDGKVQTCKDFIRFDVRDEL